MCGRQRNRLAQGHDGLVVAHAAREQDAEVVVRHRVARLQFAAAPQGGDRLVVVAGFREHGAERVVLQGIVGAMRDRERCRLHRPGVVSTQAAHARVQAQYLGVIGNCGKYGREQAFGLVDPPCVECLRRNDDLHRPRALEAVQARHGGCGRGACVQEEARKRSLV